MSRRLPWFTVIILASVLLWQSLFSLVCAPGKQDSLQIFVTASRCDSQKMKAALQALPLEEISIFCQSSTGSHYNDYLTTAGILSSDLLIVDSAVFDLEYAWQEFAPLDSALLARYGLQPGDYSYVSAQGQSYAIIVYDETAGIALLSDMVDVCQPGRQYCIAVNRNLPNAAPYSQGADTTDCAFRALAMLLGAGKEP